MPMPNQDDKNSDLSQEGALDDAELRLEGEAEVVRDEGSASPSAQGAETLKMPQASETEKLLAQIDEWKSRAAYLAAEVDNMRKRFARERLDVVKLANESLIRNLLPVLDNLQLGVKAVNDGDKSLRENSLFANLFKGIEMVAKHFEQSLEQVGVKAIKAHGQTFDPNLHEAIGQSNNADQGDDVVSGELQKGFTLHERVLRPAKVIVNKIQN